MAKAKEVTEAVDTSAEETIQEEVQHSDWFYKVKDYYDTKRWNLVMQVQQILFVCLGIEQV